MIFFLDLLATPPYHFQMAQLFNDANTSRNGSNPAAGTPSQPAGTISGIVPVGIIMVANSRCYLL
jgi:hypothetical protein